MRPDFSVLLIVGYVFASAAIDAQVLTVRSSEPSKTNRARS